MVVLCCVVLRFCLCLAVGWGAAAALGSLWGAGSALRRAGQPFARAKSRWAAPEKQRRRVGLRRAFLGPCLFQGAFGKGMTPIGIDTVRRCNSIASWLVRSALASGRCYPISKALSARKTICLLPRVVHLPTRWARPATPSPAPVKSARSEAL